MQKLEEMVHTGGLQRFSVIAGECQYNRKWGLAACCSKTDTEARLVERKVCTILDAGNWGGERAETCPKAD